MRMSILAQMVAAVRLDSERRSRAAVIRSILPAESPMVWAKPLCAGLAIFLRRFSSSSVSAKSLFPRSSYSSPLPSASLPEFRSVSETLRILPLGFSLLSLLVSARARSFSFSCVATFSVWVSAIRPPMANSPPEPSEFASVSPHRFVAPEGRSRQ